MFKNLLIKLRNLFNIIEHESEPLYYPIWHVCDNCKITVDCHNTPVPSNGYVGFCPICNTELKFKKFGIKSPDGYNVWRNKK